jgi:hypothetical protein
VNSTLPLNGKNTILAFPTLTYLIQSINKYDCLTSIFLSLNWPLFESSPAVDKILKLAMQLGLNTEEKLSFKNAIFVVVFISITLVEGYVSDKN